MKKLKLALLAFRLAKKFGISPMKNLKNIYFATRRIKKRKKYM